MSIIGVPWGVRCDIKSLKKFNNLKIIIDSHRDKDNDKQNLICLEAVKIYGISPMKLLIKIIKKIDINIIILEREKLIKALNSLNMKFVMIYHIIIYRDGTNQN
jgi:hypothetical protein